MNTAPDLVLRNGCEVWNVEHFVFGHGKWSLSLLVREADRKHQVWWIVGLLYINGELFIHKERVEDKCLAHLQVQASMLIDEMVLEMDEILGGTL